MRLSSAEFIAVQARIDRSRNREAGAAPVKPSGSEADLHNAILDECKRRGWIALHGSMAHSTFRTEGEWDFTILGDNGRVWFVECKTGTGKLSTAQLGLHAWAKQLGHCVHVVRSLEEFTALL